MGIKTKDVVIDGETYTLQLLGAIEGKDLGLELLKSVAPAIKVLSTAADKGDAALVAGVAELVMHLDRKTLTMLCDAFGRKSTVTLRLPQGEAKPLVSDVFDDHFAGRYITMSMWLGECVVFNFAGPFGGGSLGKLIDMFKAKGEAVMASTSGSPKASTGSSGAS